MSIRSRVEAFAEELAEMEERYGFQLVALADGARYLELYCHEDGEFYDVKKVAV